MKKIILTLVLLFTTTTAHADFGILGGISSYNTSNNFGNTDAASGFVGGLMFSTSVLMVGPTLEVDALYDHRDISFGAITETRPEIQIPVLIRAPLIPELLNFGLGAYYGFGVGNVSDSTGASNSYSGAGVSSSDFGLLASVQAGIPIPGIARVIVDARYLFGLTNESTVDGFSSHTRELELMAGIVLSM